jgi:hypothetical protein
VKATIRRILDIESDLADFSGCYGTVAAYFIENYANGVALLMLFNAMTFVITHRSNY